MTSTVTAEIDVDVPVRTAYDQWTQFETFPEFMHAVKSIDQLEDERTHWVVSIGGVTREFDAIITEQVPDDHVAWASVEERLHAGVVSFAPAPDGGTQIELTMSWEPETFVEKAGAALALDERQAEADLRRFKEYIEERGSETGGWRGTISDGGTVV